jgi:hypothetical protein
MLVLMPFEVRCTSREGCWDDEAGLMGRGIQPQDGKKSADLEVCEFRGCINGI